MAEGDLKWKYDTGANVQSGIVVDSNDDIYFGAGPKIISLHSDGALKWEMPLTDIFTQSGLAFSIDESVVYIGNNTEMWAFYTATGVQKWKYIGNKMGYTGIAVDPSDNIYAGCFGVGDKGAFSVDYAGNFRWDLASDYSFSGLAIGKSNTVVYYLDEAFGLRELRLTDGNINWTHIGPTWSCAGSGVQIEIDGTIHYGALNFFYAINPDGSEKWNFPIGGKAVTNNAIGSNGNIWFIDTFEGGVPATLYSLTPAGVEDWHYDFPAWAGWGYGATGLSLDSNDIAYAGCWDNKLYAINSDGSFRWSYAAGNNILSGIAFSHIASPAESTVYFGSDDNFLYALEKLPAPPAGGGSSLPLLAKLLL